MQLNPLEMKLIKEAILEEDNSLGRKVKAKPPAYNSQLSKHKNNMNIVDLRDNPMNNMSPRLKKLYQSNKDNFKSILQNSLNSSQIREQMQKN